MTDHAHPHPAPSGRPRKQEQEEASEEITEVAPGILRLQLPTDFTGLGHVNTYAIEDGRGVTLVDPGLPTEESWVALLDRLRRAGIPLARVHTVFVTHSHADHFGGAHRLVEEAGADVLTSELFRRWSELLDLDETPLEPRNPADESEAITLLAGEVDAAEADAGVGVNRRALERIRGQLRAAVDEGRLQDASWMLVPRPTITVGDRDVVRLGDRDWIAVTTPGHTHDHLCMWSPEDGVLLSGDHVLPTITPHIGGLLGGDPLAHYLSNLDKVAALEGITQVLPAHGHPFTDLPGRCEAIKEHHASRLDQLTAAAGEVGWGSISRWSQELFAPRSWGPMADSETYAHLEHLRLAGRAERRTAEGQELGDQLEYHVLV